MGKNGTRHHVVSTMVDFDSIDAWPGDTIEVTRPGGHIEVWQVAPDGNLRMLDEPQVMVV